MIPPNSSMLILSLRPNFDPIYTPAKVNIKLINPIILTAYQIMSGNGTKITPVASASILVAMARMMSVFQRKT